MIQNTTGGQLAFPLAGDDKASFENFWQGENRELVSCLKSVLARRKSHLDVELEHAVQPKVIYAYGPEGCGKSHLLYAVMRAARELDIQHSYSSLSDNYISPEMLETINASGLVCIDNIQAWACDNRRERALFTLFEQIKHAGGQLIVMAKQAPEVSQFSIRDLVSRLSSGLIYPMHELSDEQRFEALKMRAGHRGLVMSDDVLKFLVSRASRNTRELFAFLDEMDKASLVEKRKITIPFLQSLLAR